MTKRIIAALLLITVTVYQSSTHIEKVTGANHSALITVSQS